MEEKEGNEPQAGNKESNTEDSSNDKIQSLTQKINNLSAELEVAKKNVLKNKNEHATLKVLFYTGLVVLLAGFIYSNYVLQRAHMRSMERNIISAEQRVSLEMNSIKMEFEKEVKGLHKQLKSVYGTDIFTTLDRMDLAISQIHPKKERTAMLINRVRLHADEFSRKLKDQANRSKIKKTP